MDPASFSDSSTAGISSDESVHRRRSARNRKSESVRSAKSTRRKPPTRRNHSRSSASLTSSSSDDNSDLENVLGASPSKPSKSRNREKVEKEAHVSSDGDVIRGGGSSESEAEETTEMKPLDGMVDDSDISTASDSSEVITVDPDPLHDSDEKMEGALKMILFHPRSRSLLHQLTRRSALINQMVRRVVMSSRKASPKEIAA